MCGDLPKYLLVNGEEHFQTALLYIIVPTSKTMTVTVITDNV